MKTKTVLVCAGIVVASLMTGGCGSKGASSPRASFSNISIPPAGITAVKDVAIKPQSGNEIRFEAVSSAAFSMNDVLAVIYCRAAGYQKDNGFAAMQVMEVSRMASNNPQSPQLVTTDIEYYGDPVPADTKALTKDWCPEVPAAAAAG